jgi:uncharacterized protein (DUF488 family)
LTAYGSDFLNSRCSTIGFTNKTAQHFFSLLESNRVTKIIDTRINNTSQLAGFAKGNDLAFFTKRICNANYEHCIDFAPTKDLLDRYRKKKITWAEYEPEYLNLLDLRNIKAKVHIEALHQCCLLCSEHLPDKCHRRLLAEYLQKVNNLVNIVHLR